MNIDDTYKDQNILLIEDTFDEFELIEIWKELDFITNKNIMLPPELTHSALNPDKKPIKNNSAVFLFNIYSDHSISPIIRYTANKLFSKQISEEYVKINYMNNFFKSTNGHTTFVSYYEENDFYDFHKDESLYTSLTYLYREPKFFEGGDLLFKVNNSEVEIKIKNNFSVIFPSFYEHSVSPVSMLKEYGGLSGNGRYCITQFTFTR
jgi:hypothetical protein